MYIKKYSMFYSLNIRYTVNINKEHEKESVKGKGENSYEEKNCFTHYGSIVWTFSYRMWF